MPRNENMSNASLKWSMAHLRPWSSTPQAKWGTWHPCSTRDWLHSCRSRDERPIHSHWAGSVPTLVFPAPVCNHVHTRSSIKHQARREGMWQLRPRHSWGPHPRVTMTLVVRHPIIRKWHVSVPYITTVLLPVLSSIILSQYYCTVLYCTAFNFPVYRSLTMWLTVLQRHTVCQNHFPICVVSLVDAWSLVFYQCLLSCLFIPQSA